MDVNVELLVGTQVHDTDGAQVGRIQEFRADCQGGACVVESYLIGSSALIERLSAWTLVRPIARALHARKLYSLYEVPWQDMDLSDPKRPILRTAKKDLRHAR